MTFLHRRAPLLLAVVLGATLVAACSEAPPTTMATTATVRPPTSTTTTTKPAPKPAAPKPVGVAVTGAPKALSQVIARFYAGTPVPTSSAVAGALKKRHALKASLKAASAGGAWRNQAYAVVTAGDDVTLAVFDPMSGWKVVGGWWPSIGIAQHVLGAYPKHILAVGSDARPGEDVTRSRGDSLHIIGMDGRGGGGILGIPRDSYVALGTGRVGKINSALSRGGPDALVSTVAANTGVPIDGYLLTGFDGFMKTVDKIGGIQVSKLGGLAMPAQGLPLGAGSLNGEASLWLARERHSVAGGDFGRSANQGRIVIAAGLTLALRGPSAVPAYLSALAPNVVSNLSAEQMLTFVMGGFSINLDKVGNRVASGPTGTSPSGESIVTWNAQTRALFADIKDGNLQ